jgi:hypothetical protein
VSGIVAVAMVCGDNVTLANVNDVDAFLAESMMICKKEEVLLGSQRRIFEEATHFDLRLLSCLLRLLLLL